MEKEIKRSEKLINKITEGDIKPRPRWHFVFENYIFWSVFFVFTLFGSTAFSVILYVATESDFDLLISLSSSKIQLLIVSLPFLWIFFLVIFLAVSIFGVRHTKTGYRYSLLKILGANILLSILLGGLFFSAGGAQKIENIFAEKVSIYRSVEEHKISRWSHPENGFLAGMILENKNGEIILMEDFSGKQWEINIQNAIVRSRVFLEPEEKIKIIGKIAEENIFTAEEIRKWENQEPGRKNRK